MIHLFPESDLGAPVEQKQSIKYTKYCEKAKLLKKIFNTQNSNLMEQYRQK